MAREFAVRGVVEGFYGTPWSHDARIDVLTFVGERGMNAYVYAPKDDPKHRALWREAYTDDEQRHFAELAAHAGSLGIRLGFAISPGLDIAYESPDDRTALLAKLVPLHEHGVAWFLLLVDDIPLEPGLAPRQADLATWLREQLPDAQLTLCPTEYVGTQPSAYLADLARRLPPEVGVMWTGPTVCSPTITVADAKAWSEVLGGRAPLVWDNYPVNDGAMAHALHLGPYRGREPGLADVVAGVLCNPMTQPHASKIALATAAAFLRDPDGYREQPAWHDAIAAVGGARAEPLGVLARACADGPLALPAELDLATRVDALDTEIDGPGWADAVAGVAAELRAARALPEVFAGAGGSLDGEVAPWAATARTEAEAGLAALKLIQQLRPVATLGGDGQGRAVAPVPQDAMHAAFLMLYSWDAARTTQHVVFGPRFAHYPAVVQLADGAPGLHARLAVREDANAIDRLCRLALAAYDEWCSATRDLRAFVDGSERDVGPDGSFDARGEMVLLRCGPYATRITSQSALPFRDVRLS